MPIAELVQKYQVKEDEQLTAEVIFLPDFFVTLAHMTEAQYKRIGEKSVKTVFVNHRKTSVPDAEKLADHLAGHILGWRGLTRRTLSLMLWLRMDGLSEEDKQAEIAYSHEEARALLLHHQGFARWMIDTCLNQYQFANALEGSEKNLPSGPASGPSPAESPATAAEPSATN